MDKQVTTLVSPPLRNSSCEYANSTNFLNNLMVTDVLQAFFIITLTLAIIIANLVVIIVINCRRYESFIHPQVSVARASNNDKINTHHAGHHLYEIFMKQLITLSYKQPRYLITSLALNDLAIGLLITPFGTIPALLHCWPYGEIFCQIQVSLVPGSMFLVKNLKFMFSFRLFFEAL